jgi:hypothetical protein
MLSITISRSVDEGEGVMLMRNEMKLFSKVPVEGFSERKNGNLSKRFCECISFPCNHYR